MSAYEILKAIAHKCAAGESIAIAPDWGLGSGTLIFQDGSHTHFGADIEDDPKKAVDDFIQGLHALLVWSDGFKVTDPIAFTKAIASHLENDEEEDGTTAIHRILDEAAEHAIESACEGVEEVEPDEDAE